MATVLSARRSQRALAAASLLAMAGCSAEGDPSLDAAPGDSQSPRDASALDAATLGDATASRDATAAGDASAARDATPTDATTARDAATGCAGSASGTSSIWTCTADHTARQRCVSGALQSETCRYGACIPQPSGVDDLCPSDPAASNAATYCAGGNCVHWWDCRITYQYQYATSGDWDTDYHMPDGTPIALPHRAQLTAVYLVGSGFQPEFTDLVTGEWMHFNHLHLNSEFGGNDRALGPVQLVAMTDPAHADHVYPAGWVVGFSGGGTSRTGYLGTDASGNTCTGGHSTAAHFCAVTRVAHPIDYYLPTDTAGCTAPLGWPSALWSMIHPLAPSYASCPSVCTGCGVAHF